jgi:uncharacterized protein YndB with AHSA1/START domain
MGVTPWPEQYLLHIEAEVFIRNSAQCVFDGLLQQIGPDMTQPDGEAIPLAIEPWPGGRWYRNTGPQSGHLWGHVQVIKPPLLLEFSGPLFMSYPVVSHVQFRLTERAGGVRLVVVHRAMGDILPQHRQAAKPGWQDLLMRIKKRCGDQ